MRTRDQYVKQLKTQLDRWSKDVARWEKQAKAARDKADARWRADIDKVRAQREKAVYQLALLEKASTSAWGDFTKGAEKAWGALRGALEQARTHFRKAPARKKAAPRRRAASSSAARRGALRARRHARA